MMRSRFFQPEIKPCIFSRTGITLLELVVVVAILAALGSMVIPRMQVTRDEVAKVTTEASLVAIRDALLQYWPDTKRLALPESLTVEGHRFQLRWLFESPGNEDDEDWFFNPDTRTGWNGPYLLESKGRYEVSVELVAAGFTEVYGADGDPAVLDAFSNLPIVIQAVDAGAYWDIRILSAGPNGVIDTDPAIATESLSPGSTGDDVYVSLRLRR